MSSGIFLLQANESLLRMNEQPYEAETLLQKLLADHTDLLAGDQINPELPRRWVFIKQEMGVAGQEGGSDQWSLDHLFIDQDAVPTFVEVKRASDTRARREVVAQMLDYAANAVSYWPISRMRQQHARSCEIRGIDAEYHLLELIGEDGDIEGFWNLAEQNLRSGRIRLMFVADEIRPELRRIVEFLNQQMNPAEVLALEVKQFVGSQDGSQLRTLVPRLIGQTEASREQKRTGPSGPSAVPRQLVPVEDFSSLIDSSYRESVERIIEVGNASLFEIRPHASPKTNYVRFFAPPAKGDIFSLATDGFIWINLQNHEKMSDPALQEQLQAMLLTAFPEKRNDIVNNFARNTYVGFRYDQISDETRLSAIEQAINLAEAAIFGDSQYQASEDVGEI